MNRRTRRFRKHARALRRAKHSAMHCVLHKHAQLDDVRIGIAFVKPYEHRPVCSGKTKYVFRYSFVAWSREGVERTAQGWMSA